MKESSQITLGDILTLISIIMATISGIIILGDYSYNYIKLLSYKIDGSILDISSSISIYKCILLFLFSSPFAIAIIISMKKKYDKLVNKKKNTSYTFIENVCILCFGLCITFQSNSFGPDIIQNLLIILINFIVLKILVYIISRVYIKFFFNDFTDDKTDNIVEIIKEQINEFKALNTRIKQIIYSIICYGIIVSITIFTVLLINIISNMSDYYLNKTFYIVNENKTCYAVIYQNNKNAITIQCEISESNNSIDLHSGKYKILENKNTKFQYKKFKTVNK